MCAACRLLHPRRRALLAKSRHSLPRLLACEELRGEARQSLEVLHLGAAGPEEALGGGQRPWSPRQEIGYDASDLVVELLSRNCRIDQSHVSRFRSAEAIASEEGCSRIDGAQLRKTHGGDHRRCDTDSHFCEAELC